jgi:23S rRNA G2445 N2-methylase RlmL
VRQVLAGAAASAGRERRHGHGRYDQTPEEDRVANLMCGTGTLLIGCRAPRPPGLRQASTAI